MLKNISISLSNHFGVNTVNRRMLTLLLKGKKKTGMKLGKELSGQNEKT